MTQEDRSLTSLKLAAGLFATSLAVTAASGSPVKIGVKVDHHSIAPGEKLTLTIELLDSANRLAKACTPLPISLQVRIQPNNVQQLQPVTIPGGQSSVTASVTLPGTGLEYVWAKNAQLNVGGAYVNVRQPRLAPAPAIAFRPGLAFTKAATPQIALRFS